LALFAIPAIVPSAMAQQHKAQPPKFVRLYVFDCGSLDIPDTSAYQLKKEDLATTMMSVPCFLVVHPKGTMMWDTGRGSRQRFQARWWPRDAAIRDVYQASNGAVGRGGLRPGRHQVSGTLALSLGPRWQLQSVCERHLAGAQGRTGHHVRRAAFFAHGACKLQRAQELARPYSSRKDDYDVFGDKTVMIKSAPGHSPGHQVLFLKLAKTGPILLGGDLYHYPEERKLNKVPTTEFNAVQTIASRAAVEAFLRQTGAQLWIQHDYAANAKLKKAPDFYE
jgi:N-acyl homoserine lactone hydrolase